MFTEIKPYGRQPIRLERLDRSAVRLGNQTYETVLSGAQEELMDGDVRVDVVDFCDERLYKYLDAAYISIKPRKSTPIQSWRGERIFVETVTAGQATWIGSNPWGDPPVRHEFDADRDGQGLIAYGEGWIGSWIAGRHGCEILEICNPRYFIDGTVFVAELGANKIGNRILPITFQALYAQLMNIDFE